MMDDYRSEPLVFRIDEKLLQARPPRLTLAATLTALRKQVRAGDLDPNFVVNILDENRLLPYMITYRKNFTDVSLGRNTNASKVGDLIVSEECIRGTYELCISFLEFVLDIIRRPNYKDATRTMLASVCYMANEIYPSHHIWTYRNISDMTKISCLCTEIFHDVIANIPEPAIDYKYNDLEIVCVLSLSQNLAHKQLLDTIVDGRTAIEKSIEQLSLSDELSLQNLPIVISVRQSLFIFNKLLLHSRYLKQYFSDSGTLSATEPWMTNIERALFDTSVRPGCLQHLFSFIHQKKDSVTACLAVDLIKNVAKKFSMSLMALLGSEADKVCKFFVECLANKESNIDLEVAILDLLTSCVKYQPGLIDLFLNNKWDTSTGLDVIIDLLKHCCSREEYFQKLLHSHCMEFVLTFWQKGHSAIEQFDKSEQFWDSVAHPLLKFLDESKQENVPSKLGDSTKKEDSKQQSPTPVQLLNDTLNAYVLMILAREIFCLNSNVSERKMNPKLDTILKELSTKNLLSKYSSFIKRTMELTSDGNYQKEDYSRVLNSWRDFLGSFAKFRPFEISPIIENNIVSNLLSCMAIELRLADKIDKERITATGDTLLLIWIKWMPKEGLSKEDYKFDAIHELLYLVDANKEYLPFSFLLTFQAILNLYLIRNENNLINCPRSFDLLVPAMQLMHFDLRVLEKHLNEVTRQQEHNYKCTMEARLSLTSIMGLRFILNVSRGDHSLWLSYVQENLKTESLLQFMALLMRKRIGSEVCLSLAQLLLCLSSIQEMADYLNKAGLISQLNMIGAQRIVMMNASPEWLQVYESVLKLNLTMLVMLDKDYMNVAIDFISLYCTRICELLESQKVQGTLAGEEEVSATIRMINLMNRRASAWKKRDPHTYDAILRSAGTTLLRYQLEVDRNLNG